MNIYSNNQKTKPHHHKTRKSSIGWTRSSRSF